MPRLCLLVSCNGIGQQRLPSYVSQTIRVHVHCEDARIIGPTAVLVRVVVLRNISKGTGETPGAKGVLRQRFWYLMQSARGCVRDGYLALLLLASRHRSLCLWIAEERRVLAPKQRTVEPEGDSPGPMRSSLESLCWNISEARSRLRSFIHVRA